jgi:hypothetical protein
MIAVVMTSTTDPATPVRHADLTPARLHGMIRRGAIAFGGYAPRKRPGMRIYGLLTCWSGKKMHAENRVFFGGEAQAIAAGFRPCAHCMPAAYRAWKARAAQDAA